MNVIFRKATDITDDYFLEWTDSLMTLGSGSLIFTRKEAEKLYADIKAELIKHNRDQLSPLF